MVVPCSAALPPDCLREEGRATEQADAGAVLPIQIDAAGQEGLPVRQRHDSQSLDRAHRVPSSPPQGTGSATQGLTGGMW